MALPAEQRKHATEMTVMERGTNGQSRERNKLGRF